MGNTIENVQNVLRRITVNGDATEFTLYETESSLCTSILQECLNNFSIVVYGNDA
ncbi:MAG: hypothetical protein HYZ34_07940 [Ignavibacteriae bacterium]|nr:hypothetical protein [Ignavibacteriota bacterium]